VLAIKGGDGGNGSNHGVAAATNLTSQSTLASPSVTISYTLFSTTSTVTSSVPQSVLGQPVTLTGTVVATTPGAGTPTGALTLRDGTAVLGSGALSGGSFSVTLPALSVGTHVITATYDGADNFLPSTSAPFNQVVMKDSATAVVTSTVNPSVSGQPVVLTATVTADSPGSGIPTGVVEFFDGVILLGSGTLNGSAPPAVSLLPTASLSVGTHHIVAKYAGDGSFLSSNSADFVEVVNKAQTVTALVANPAGSVGFGHAVTFIATVSVIPPGAGAPAGNVVFSVDGVPVQTLALDSSERASVSTSSISPGSHLIQAAYAGNSNFLGSSTAISNYLVTCTSTVSGNHPGALIASGDSICVVTAAVGGSITVAKGTSLAVIGSTVGGAISASGPLNAIKVCGSTIGGSVDVVNAQGLVVVGDPGDAICASNRIKGVLLLQNNTHGVEAIGNMVGNLTVSGNSGPGPFPGDDTNVSGNIIVH
jgi:hypothetical protein